MKSSISKCERTVCHQSWAYISCTLKFGIGTSHFVDGTGSLSYSIRGVSDTSKETVRQSKTQRLWGWRE